MIMEIIIQVIAFYINFPQNETNTRLHNQNPAIFYSFLTDYNYLCHIRATAK